MIKRTIAEVLKSGDYVGLKPYRPICNIAFGKLPRKTFNHCRICKYAIFNDTNERLVCTKFNIAKFGTKGLFTLFLLELKRKMTARDIAEIMQVDCVYLNKVLWQVANSDYTT